MEFQVQKKLVNAGAHSLEIFEELESFYNDSQAQVLDTIKLLPIESEHKKLIESIIIQGNVFTPNRISSIRKRVFDYVNNAARSLKEEFLKYKVNP